MVASWHLNTTYSKTFTRCTVEPQNSAPSHTWSHVTLWQVTWLFGVARHVGIFWEVFFFLFFSFLSGTSRACWQWHGVESIKADITRIRPIASLCARGCCLRMPISFTLSPNHAITNVGSCGVVLDGNGVEYIYICIYMYICVYCWNNWHIFYTDSWFVNTQLVCGRRGCLCVRRALCVCPYKSLLIYTCNFQCWLMWIYAQTL